ncbi:LamG domain-containing protein [Mesorhizobium sp. BR1-1-4]|uniref:LamG domain-containing protein n=1 Tax=Mesorhizobium sp. BR1-1-4 TaxID=2876650 RepID=UPI001CCA97E0|nr:LamG domain-containing protein [Mesorhizobium sp. BR1-1-4]MBZ9926790.1 LamG domain-containing protein [Mesorhizobium sp. BR1-1-4]
MFDGQFYPGEPFQFMDGLLYPIIGGINEADLNFASVVVLLHGDGANGSTTITDSSPSPKTFTANGTAQISTAQSLFSSGGSIRLTNGTTDYISAAANAAFALPGDFTIEFAVRFNTAPATDRNIFHTNINSGWAIYQTTTAGSWQFAKAGVSSELAFSWSPTTAVWYRLACSRTSNVLKIFIDGSQVASGASSTSFLQSGLWFGRDLALSRYIDCWVEEIRITKGVGRYSANYTPRTYPFPDA